MAASAFAKPPPPDCPRCGYDLSGLVKTWTTDCPLAGRCSECGLDFAWADVLNPARRIPAWSFEHAIQRRHAALCETWFRAMAPRALWRTLRLELPISLPRLCLLLLASYLLTHASFSALVIGGDLLEGHTLAYYSLTGWLTSVAAPALAFPYLQEIPNLRSEPLVIAAAWTWSTWLLASLCMFVLDETLQRVRAKRRHLLRGIAYSAPGVALITLFSVILLAGTQRTRMSSPPVPVPVIALAALLPPFWLGYWWYHFFHSYLRLPRALLVTIVLLLLSLFAALVLWFWIALET